MIRILKAIGNFIWITLIALILFRAIDFEPPVWWGILLGASLAGIPRDCFLDAQRKMAWVVLLFSVFLMGSQDMGLWTFFGFLVFVLSGVAAGLPFEAGDGGGGFVD
jgi:hypothetical protein